MDDAWHLPASEGLALPWQTVDRKRTRSSGRTQAERLGRGALARGTRTLQRRHAYAHGGVAKGGGGSWPVIRIADGPLTVLETP